MNKFHAKVAGNILREVGDDEATIGRVAMLVRKEALKTDAEAQMLEDLVDLVFLESYLAGFVATQYRYDIAKFRDILAKMAKKMSACGRAAALTRETRAARTRAADRGRDGGSGRRLVAVTVHRSALSGSPMPLSRGASACRDDACMDAASDL